MSFEKHAIVSSYLAARNVFYKDDLDMYKALSKDLYEKLAKYEEQEAINSTLGKTLTFSVDGNVTIHATSIKFEGEIK